MSSYIKETVCEGGICVCCGIIFIYVVNMHFSNLLIRKLLWLIASQNIARHKRQTEYREKEGKSRERYKPVSQETRCHQTSKRHAQLIILRLVEWVNSKIGTS